MTSVMTKCNYCKHAVWTFIDNDLWDFKCKLGESPKTCKKDEKKTEGEQQ